MVQHSSPLTHDQNSAFAESARSVRRRLTEAIDLILIHNEKNVRGDQPRTVLNPLTVLLAVSAWERLVADIKHLSTGKAWPGPELAKSEPGSAWPDNAFTLLEAVTKGALPNDFEVCTFTAYKGKTPTGAKLFTGLDHWIDEGGTKHVYIADELRAWITTRNGVAHYCLPQKAEDGIWKSDADGSNGLTVQAGSARACVAFFVQLVDQTVRGIAAHSDFSLGSSDTLPIQWFDAELPAKIRGVDNPGTLWGGATLTRHRGI